MLIQTVCTVSHLNKAMTMIKSISRFHEDLEFSVLVTDIISEGKPKIQEVVGSRIEILCCEDIGMEATEKMRQYYNAFEHSCACKFIAVYHQFLHNRQECLYLDTDIYALSSLDSFFESLNQDIVVTPHSLSICNKFVGGTYEFCDLNIITVGHINGGILYFKNTPKSVEALKWLIESVQSGGFFAPGMSMYCDQHWVSLLPYYFSDNTEVLKDPSVNIAFWNLHERKLSEENHIIMANGKAAQLFHFSSFQIPNHGKLVGFSSEEGTLGNITRHLFFQRLIKEYEQQLIMEKERFADIEHPLGFCNGPLHHRLCVAQDMLGIRYSHFGLEDIPIIMHQQ
ncbi:hypothetical protein CLHUN_03760 [Ruminiclostridium hungatei]|uniref:Glycosyl transferase family 8 n=2 Tax=Ruminiclostridium hungatei TaxID=48256 RepID=A0A1V4SQ48_RUMHU|nr:hypothetical protein CLHUN_03760 [Ruminiclostridium hungatei]